MIEVISCMGAEHDRSLIIVAIGICLATGITAFTLAASAQQMWANRKRHWLVGLGFVTGAGIWSTHFIAMLSWKPNMPTAYAPLPTYISVAITMLFSALAWWCVLKRIRYAAVLGGLLMASGFASMHFIGTAALQTLGSLHYDMPLVAIALALGTLMAIGAFALFMARPGIFALWPGLLLFAAAIIIHFGSMSSTTLIPDPRRVIAAETIDAHSMAVSVVAMVVALLVVAMTTASLEERLLRQSASEADRLMSFTENAHEGLVVLDGGRLVDANALFCDMLGCGQDSLPIGLAMNMLLPDYVDAIEAADTNFADLILRRVTGGVLDVEVAIQRWGAAHDEREILILRDITARKTATAQLAHLATHDSLTGAASRTAFVGLIERTIARGDAFALICFDVDRFKTINDVHGHFFGDAVLIEIVRRVRNFLRPDDILARIGGDEFAIIQVADLQPDRAGALAEQTRSSLDSDIVVNNVAVKVSMSFGIAISPSDADDGTELLRKADIALRRAKSDGRGQYRCYEPVMDRLLVARHQLALDLDQALAAQQLALHYQPLACAITGDILGFEALLRWNHPERGMVSQAQFIPLAEETGAILAIGDWVISAACAEAAGWAGDFKVAVNLSPRQFEQGDIIDTVRRALVQSGLAAHRLELEITEGLLLSDPKRALVALQGLKALGVTIAVDDFGTGYSSLSYFRQFPFDKIKIDQSFVRDMASCAEAMIVIKAVIGLGTALGLRVIAEGVETAEQLVQLRAAGCNEVQGYLFSKPAPIGSFEAVVRDGHADALAAGAGFGPALRLVVPARRLGDRRHANGT